MDAMRGLDPTSSKFHTQAARNIQQVGVGTLKTQKEVKQGEDDGPHVERDHVNLSGKIAAPDHGDAMLAHSMSGELGEIADDLTEDDSENQEIRDRERERKNEGLSHGGFDQVHDVPTAQQARRIRELDDAQLAIEDILKDIPQRSLEPARNMVAAQIQAGRPSQSLTQLKPVEGVNALDFEPAPALGFLDIHDTHNAPLAQDPSEGMDASQQQAVAGFQLDQMIGNLPDDRKATVEELRTAVTSWATAEGVDPGAAFADKLHDLAQGWDDDSLKLAARSYADASREVGSAAAAE